MAEESGSINEFGEALVLVEFSSGVKVEFLIDTGFSGHLCIPKSAMNQIGIKATSTTFVSGVGTFVDTYDVGKTDIVWCEENLSNIEVLINEGSDFLLGTALLGNKELYINFKTNEVLINS
jgi:clan AA aspartic protease